MNESQAEALAKSLNRVGVLLYVEVNGTQHRFKLRINELSPASVVYQRNREHIEDTEYTLLPTAAGESIKNIGKKLFDPGLQFALDDRDHELTGADYVATDFGRYFSIDSLWKYEQVQKNLRTEMRERADALVGAENYRQYYRDAFVRAYHFFSADMDEFRNQLKTMEGELHLFWEEVAKIYNQLAEFERNFTRRQSSRTMRIGDLDAPDLKAAYKLRHVPRTYEEYREDLRLSETITGFHILCFKKWAWRDDFWEIKDFRSARSLFLAEEHQVQPGLFDDE
jgi:hypothetical protein